MSSWARRAFGTVLAMLVAAMLALAPRPAFAEPKKPDQKAKVEARRAQVRARILKEVGISEEKGKQVEAILKKYEPQRQKLMREQRMQRQAIRQLLQQDSDDEEAYKKAIEGFRATQKKLTATRDKELDELSKILNPKQQAKLVAALLRLRKKVAEQRAPAPD